MKCEKALRFLHFKNDGFHSLANLLFEFYSIKKTCLKSHSSFTKVTHKLRQFFIFVEINNLNGLQQGKKGEVKSPQLLSRLTCIKTEMKLSAALLLSNYKDKT